MESWHTGFNSQNDKEKGVKPGLRPACLLEVLVFIIMILLRERTKQSLDIGSESLIGDVDLCRRLHVK